MEEYISSAKLLEQIAQQNIVIYGAGHIAGKFLKALKRYHYDKNVLCFVVSHPEQSAKMIEGIPVRTLDWLAGQRDLLVCIAVHESLRRGITVTLHNLGISRYIWIYPCLYELILGMPVETDVNVALDDIIPTCAGDYRLAIRYAAIEQYLGKNEIGFAMYKKAQALHSSPETAEERLAAFCRLIESWRTKGYDEKSRISINTDYEVIDGNHRVALAKYFDQKQIKCDIYEKRMGVTELHGVNAMLTDKVLLREGFGSQEMKCLDEMNRMIKGG